MSTDTDIWATTSIAQSGIKPDSSTGAAVEGRSDILQMTQTAENAVLRPDEPGRWPHDLRAALACRMAQLIGAEELAQTYRAMMQSQDFAALTDPKSSAAPAEHAACLRFVDRVAARAHDVSADDIRILQDARISDADIVRLTELIAFVAYQARLAIGLSLLAGAQS